MRRACVLALLALVALASAAGHSVPLRRTPNRVHQSFSDVPAFLNKYRGPNGAPAGSSIPMKVRLAPMRLREARGLPIL